GTSARRGDQPADSQSLAALRANFDGHLIGGAADTAGPHFDIGTNVVERVVEHTQRLLTGALGNPLEGVIDGALGDGLFPIDHHNVHEFHKGDVTEFGIRQNFTLFSLATTRHVFFLLALLRPLRAVLRARLLAVLDTLGIERAANDVIANAGKILHATAADHDHGVFLKVVAFA